LIASSDDDPYTRRVANAAVPRPGNILDRTGHVVVIGSGPAGAAAALTLVEQGVAVTMMESGPTYVGGLLVRAFARNLYRKWAPAGTRYQFAVSGDPGTQWPNALVPGGLSNYWTGAVPRFSPEDFTEGARLDECYRWPITYAELAPFYRRVERLVEVVGDDGEIPQVGRSEVLVHRRRLPPAWRRVGEHAAHNGQGMTYVPIADGPPWLIRRSGAAFNSFDRIVSKLTRSPLFTLRLGSHAQRLTWSGSAGRVTGVAAIDLSTHRYECLGADAVVVAAGPLASPKLLLQSVSDDFPEGLGNTNGVLGRYLHDHPKDWCVLHLDQPLPRLDQPIYVSRAPYSELPPLAGASVTIGPMAKWDRLASLIGLRTRRFGLVTFSTMRPNPENRVRLHRNRQDEFETPLLDIELRFGPEVAATIADAQSRLHRILQEAGVGMHLERSVETLMPGSSAHYGGAARMHDSRFYGVVDGWNRLHDVSNVLVVDASSFTTAVEKNPTLTVMAIASRAADHLAQQLRHDPSSAATDARSSAW
jgi:choline dehydrogenase-like flavoprotein